MSEKGSSKDKFMKTNSRYIANLKIDEIESFLHERIREILMNKFSSENEWWIKGIPLPIRKKCSERYEEAEWQGERFNYVDIVDLKDIIDKNWKLFEFEFPFLNWRKNKKILINKIQELNDLRKKVKHYVRGYKPTDSDIAFLNELLKKLKIVT